jgi:hypothetical protein
MHQPDRKRRHRLGSYGVGTLSCLKSRTGLFVLFNDTLIARRGHPRAGAGAGAWLQSDVSWVVTSLGGAEVLVQHNDDEGVVISLGAGVCIDSV